MSAVERSDLPLGQPYFCPASGEVEQRGRSGFDVCCDRPDLHRAPEGQQPKLVTEEEFRAVSGQFGAQVVVEVLRKVDERLFALPYTNVGNLPRVEREHLSTAVNETAKEFLGADWVAIMRGEYDWVARVRADVAEEIAVDMEEWSRRQFAQASAAWNPQSKRDLEAYGTAYGNAANVARQHAGKPAESVVAALPDVVGTPDRVWLVHHCTAGRTWVSDTIEPPDSCPRCGAANGWFRATRVDRLPEE